MTVPLLRLVLANTEELHDRIEILCSRVRELEDALRTLQDTVSDEPHPMLRNDLLQIKVPRGVLSAVNSSSSSSNTPPAVLESTEVSDALPKEDENFIDAFGTMSYSAPRPSVLTHYPQERLPLGLLEKRTSSAKRRAQRSVYINQ